MTVKASERFVRAALNDMDLELLVYKPPDQPGPSQNQKPADFLLWWGEASYPGVEMGSAFLEVKATPQRLIFPLRDVRPSQVLSMREARRVGVIYLLVVYLTFHRRWAITTGPRVLARLDAGEPYRIQDFPINCAPGELASHLRMALLGEIS